MDFNLEMGLNLGMGLNQGIYVLYVFLILERFATDSYNLKMYERFRAGI